MRLLFILLFSGVLYAHVLPAQTTGGFKSDILSGPTPWTNTKFYNNPDHFQFAIVSDRTNGHRNGVFEQAIQKLNGMKPEFVLSIGDFIEGYTRDTAVLTQQWNEFNAAVKPLTVPFFHVPGNHDVSNDVQHGMWMKQFGRDYYHFIYKNVLFITMNSSEGDGVPFSKQQLDYVDQVIRNNAGVRWTFLLMHHPVWNNRETNGFSGIEKSLKGRPYTVIAGHTHRYLYASHNEQDYYILGTTGGSSSLRGAAFGETDHVSWVTMTERGPSLMNLELDGMLSPDFANQRTRTLAAAISKEAAVMPFVLLPEAGHQDKPGQIHFNLANHSNLTLGYRARVFQHSVLSLSENLFDMSIPANGIGQKALQLASFNRTLARSVDSIEIQWNMAYKTTEKGLPALEGILQLPVQRSLPKVVDTAIKVFVAPKTVSMVNPFVNTVLRYTLDGKEPDGKSMEYKAPFVIHKTTNVKVKVFSLDGTASSGTQAVNFNKLNLTPAIETGSGQFSAGLSYSYYEGAYKKVPDFSQMKPIKKGVLKSFDLDLVKGKRLNQFAMLIEGYVKIDQDDLYQFYLTSDDGCNLYIDDQLIVNNDGSHSARTKDGFAALRKGMHKIRFEYFEDFDGEMIRLEYSPAGKIDKIDIPFNKYFN
ncbi:PA14 domain-containing protein [Pedobacter sp. MC2016-24]|uniref:PA14 domain-containing protein n=1 Tax=Pedobacter sp. MC2016-24 TaxID=2780090 RepID=UPI001882F8EE|nr:PA14 domain-containing protein [Pedobacter sp. MC2016-24]MBE9601593.1 metallophosphoesterase [Pedobacter sp. MC2016-24]